MLLMDSASSHISEQACKVSRENQITAIMFPIHATYLFQALDLVLFNVLKIIKTTAHGDFGDDSV
jgi:hypothetical protein